MSNDNIIEKNKEKEEEKEEEENKDSESESEKLIGVWTGFAIWCVIMLAIFNGQWWAYIVLIAIGSGAIKQTLHYHQYRKKIQEVAENSNSNSNFRGGTNLKSQKKYSENDSLQIPTVQYCPGCGKRIENNQKKCSTCGFEFK